MKSKSIFLTEEDKKTLEFLNKRDRNNLKINREYELLIDRGRNNFDRYRATLIQKTSFNYVFQKTNKSIESFQKVDFYIGEVKILN